MSPETLMKWEIFIDLACLCCCAFALMYFMIARWKYSSESLSSNVNQKDNESLFLPIDSDEEDAPFNAVLASVNDDFHSTSIHSKRKRAIDPYDEARNLLNAGMNPNKIAEKLKIPRCEIEVIAYLRRIQLKSITDTKNSGTFCAN